MHFILICELLILPQDLADAQHAWLLGELSLCAAERPMHTLAFGHIPPFIHARDEPQVNCGSLLCCIVIYSNRIDR
jgi:hypothetical protein